MNEVPDKSVNTKLTIHFVDPLAEACLGYGFSATGRSIVSELLSFLGLKAAFESGLGFKQHEVQVDLIVVTKANTYTNGERRCVSTLSEEVNKSTPLV
jgi:hypothetical protein